MTKTFAAAPFRDASDAREFHFSHKDFQRIRQLIHDRAGISLSEAKRDMVYSRLARRLRACGVKRFSEYLELLRLGDEAEWEALTNAPTTNLTSFFRESHHFPLLAEHAARQEKGRKLQVWSCACSTGEEPYSIAITLAETFATLTPPVSILTRDQKTRVKDQGQACGVVLRFAVPYVPTPARKPRWHLPDGLYHLMLRGNAQQPISCNEEDREVFYVLLEEGRV